MPDEALQLFDRLARGVALLVTVDTTRGSVPREAGAWMAVFDDMLVGTIGGGRLEFEALEEARRRLAGGNPGAARLRYPLGPGLGQCCGGEVWLRYESVGPGDADRLRARLQGARTPLALFGGGHVGRALVEVLQRLPLQLTWIDSRDGIFPAVPAAQVQCEHSEPVHAAVSDLAQGSCVVIMSFSHAEDLDVLAACLLRQRQRGDLPYIGLIGSRTKWATFRHRLQARGFADAELAHVTCPIGVPGIRGKEPEVIAVAVAAQILQVQSGAARTRPLDRPGPPA